MQKYKIILNYGFQIVNFHPPIQNSEFKIASAKDERRISEGWAKESQRAGTAEYVTKHKNLCGSHWRINHLTKKIFYTQKNSNKKNDKKIDDSKKKCNFAKNMQWLF